MSVKGRDWFWNNNIESNQGAKNLAGKAIMEMVKTNYDLRSLHTETIS